MNNGPLARSADLIVDSVGDELLVYDSVSHRAHSLNSVGAAVWRACDGTGIVSRSPPSRASTWQRSSLRWTTLPILS